MKNIKYIFCTLLLTVFTLVTFNQCGDFDDINEDPNAPTQPDTRYLFVHAARFARDFHIWQTYDAYQLFYPQYISELLNVQYTDFSGTTFALSRYYTTPLKNINEIIRLNEDEAWKNTGYVVSFTSNSNQMAIMRTFRAWIFMHLTDITGMIPYSEAIKGKDGNYTPKYDTQESIYTDLFKELNEAYLQFNVNDPFPGSAYDIFYKGNVDSWKRFNASVRMQLAIKLFKRDETKGKTEFAKAYGEGFIQENNQSFTFKYDMNTPHPLYDNMQTRNDFQPSKTIVDMLKSYNDPRITEYMEPNIYGQYVGMPFGLSKSDAAKWSIDTVCQFKPKYYERTATAYLTTPSIMYFAAAEAAERGWITANAEDLYKLGIQRSLEQHGFTATDFTAYYAQPDIAYTGTTTDKINKIGVQKWLASYMQDMIEAWSDWRRLGAPDLKTGPNSLVQNIPRRRMYDSGDYNANMDNYKAAVAAQGPDTRETRVWWDME